MSGPHMSGYRPGSSVPGMISLHRDDPTPNLGTNPRCGRCGRPAVWLAALECEGAIHAGHPLRWYVSCDECLRPARAAITEGKRCSRGCDSVVRLRARSLARRPLSAAGVDGAE